DQRVLDHTILAEDDRPDRVLRRANLGGHLLGRTDDAVFELLDTLCHQLAPQACHAAFLRRRMIASICVMGAMLDLQERHVFVELTYPHLIGFGLCTASRSGDLHTGLYRVEPYTYVQRTPLSQTCTNRAKTQSQGKPWRTKGRAQIKV